MPVKLFLSKIVRFVSEIDSLEKVDDVIEESIIRPVNDIVQRMKDWTNDTSTEGLPVWLGPSGLSTRVRQKTIAYATTLDKTYNEVLCDAKTAAFTVTLPALLTSIGLSYHIMKVDATANAVTIDGNGSEVIKDATAGSVTTLTVTGQYVSVFLVATAMQEVQALTLAGTPTTDGTVTITLDGNAIAIEIVAVAKTLTQVATEIAGKNFGGVGNGWSVSSSGVVVIFVAKDKGSKAGAFSFVDTEPTGVTGTFAESTDGASAWMVH